MQTTLTYTEEQFKQTIVESFQRQIIPGVSLPKVTTDGIKMSVYIKDDDGTVAHQIDKILVEITM